jgi:hypothetical protein
MVHAGVEALQAAGIDRCRRRHYPVPAERTGTARDGTRFREHRHRPPTAPRERKKNRRPRPVNELPSFDLSGKTALVTGAARGLGRAIALALANAGADVALGLRDRTSGPIWRRPSRRPAGGRCRCKWTCAGSTRRTQAIDEAIAHFGQIDILVNNVGGGTEGPVEDFPESEFDQTIDLNVKATFFIAQRSAGT